MPVSKKVTDRIVLQLKKYQTILIEAKDRDISESDTVVIIGDMLADMLGYKKYVEITTEFAIRGTFVDLAVKVGNEIRFLVEAKAIGQSLKDNHIKQAIDYGANHGIEWVVLTNGIVWQVYKIHFKQPIDKALILEINILETTARSTQALECFANLSREGFAQSSMTAFYQLQQATSKFSLAALLTTEPMLIALRKELKKLGATKTNEDQLKLVLLNEVLKREVVDSDEAKAAMEYIKKTGKAAARAKAKSILIQ
jgi:predicted type IV restriction endonuclease